MPNSTTDRLERAVALQLERRVGRRGLQVFRDIESGRRPRAEAELFVKALRVRVGVVNLERELAAAPLSGQALRFGEKIAADATALVLREHHKIVDVEKGLARECGEAPEADSRPREIPVCDCQESER